MNYNKPTGYTDLMDRIEKLEDIIFSHDIDNALAFASIQYMLKSDIKLSSKYHEVRLKIKELKSETDK